MHTYMRQGVIGPGTWFVGSAAGVWLSAEVLRRAL